jgi:hypothetical protein
MINSDFSLALSPPPLEVQERYNIGRGERSGSRRIDRITAQQKRHGPSQEGNKRAKGGGISVCVYDKRRTLPSFFKERSKERKISFPSHPILLFLFFPFFPVWELDL